jgi:aldehyde:ferredoxin oxidoreductase
LKVLSNIAAGKNQFFKDLEKGADYCSKNYGGSDFSITFNSNEAPGYVTGPFAFIGYATGVRHSHLDNAGYSLDQKAATRPMDFERSILEMYEEGVWRMILNSLVACLFSRKIYDASTIVESLSAVGIDWSTDRLTALSHRIHGLKYLYKERNEFSLDKLTLPEKLSRVYMTNGKVDEERFRKGLELYGKLVEKDTQLLARDPE